MTFKDHLYIILSVSYVYIYLIMCMCSSRHANVSRAENQQPAAQAIHVQEGENEPGKDHECKVHYDVDNAHEKHSWK